MKKRVSKRVLTLVLVVVFVFALSISAFAAWSSYQGRNTNNGTISTAPPTGSSPTITAVPLSTNGYAYSGVDVTPVIQGNKAYALYNGGDVNGTAGGARLACIDLTSTATIWDIQLDANANNTQQLSTPYYESSTNTIYAGVTYDGNPLAGKTLSDWSSSAISGGTLTIPAGGTVTLTLSNFVLPGDYNQAYFMTGITPASGESLSGTVTLTDGTNTYAYGTSYSYAGYEFGLYNNSGVTVPAGTYTVTITLTSSAAVTSTAPITCTVSYWKLYEVTGAYGTSPSASAVASGYGQINTHINAGGGYLYFGIYEGDRCYYQFDPSNNTLISYKPNGGEDFYWAGAAKVGNYMVFGSESGKVYKRPIGAGFGTGTGTVVDLTSTLSGAGAVRSSICYDGNYLYLTTRNGYLWKLSTDLLAVFTPINIKDDSGAIYVQYSTSTPVVSANGYIYVGGYNSAYDPNTWTTTYLGAIKAVPVSNFAASGLQTVWVSNSEAVQSSVVTYSTTYHDEDEDEDFDIDYLYFTSNAVAGKGYCISYVPGLNSKSDIWNTGSVETSYTLQGVAVSDGGIVAFGNDNDKLVIVK